MEEPLVMRFYDLLERLTGLRMNEEQSDHLQVCLIYVTMDNNYKYTTYRMSHVCSFLVE